MSRLTIPGMSLPRKLSASRRSSGEDCSPAAQNSPQTVGAGDVAYSRTDDRIYASFLLFSYPEP